MAGWARSRSARGIADGVSTRRRRDTTRGRRIALSRVVVSGLLPAACALGGCDPFAGPGDDVEVVVGTAHFDFGEDIPFEVRNRTSDPITYFRCPDGAVRMGLLRRIFGDWHGFGDTCPRWEEAVLAPGETRRGRRPGVHAEGLFALQFEYRFDAGLVDGAFGLEPVQGWGNSTPFHVTP